MVLCLAFVVDASAPAAQEECEPHDMQVAQVKERLQRWSGLEPFASWKISASRLTPCVREGLVLAHLEIAPPQKWSAHQLPYRVWLTIPLDVASGGPAGPAPSAWKDLARGVKRMVARAERYEDVRRFVERFGVARAEIAATAEKDKFRVSFYSDVLPGQTQPRVPSIVYDESAPNRISSYRIPRMDSLPVRRELLRMVELLSRRHPRCSPRWIDARQTGSAVPGTEPLQWTFQVDLEGPACPPHFAARLGSDGVIRVDRPVLRKAGPVSAVPLRDAEPAR